MNKRLSLVLLSLVWLLAGCATQAHRDLEQARQRRTEDSLGNRKLMLTRESEDRILALDPDRVSEKEVREVLTNAPAPRIINIHGGLLPLDFGMRSFSQFLIGMGYPEWSVKNPGTGAYTYSCFQDSFELAGVVAWSYEKEGLRPMMLGHSVGGMQTVKVLGNMAYATNQLIIWNPVTEKTEDRREIKDPVTGQPRALVGLQMSFASALGAGGFARVVPSQWTMNSKVRIIPDTVEEFTGFYMGLDFVGGDYLGFGSANRFYPSGTARVRNVQLPTGSGHASVPYTRSLLKSQPIVDWINNFNPTNVMVFDDQPFKINANIMWAGNVWHSIKKHWVLELQHFIRARRALSDGH